MHPYEGQPDYQRWRRAVAGVEPFNFDPVISTRFKIDQSQRVATAGSCFAQHISNRLSRIGFNYFVPEAGKHLDADARKAQNYGVFSARFGNLYTTRQLLQLFQEAFGERQVSEVWEKGGRFVDPLRPQITAAGYATADEVRADRKTHLAAVRRMFEDCDIFVFTLGLTEAWQSREDGTVYPVAPGVSGGSFDPARHEFVNFGVMQVMSDLNEFLQRLKAINPAVKMILTVSPVPLIATYEPRHVLVSTTYSKSVLRVAAEEAIKKFDWIDYFPSFEIITGNYNKSAYYEDDFREVNSIGVDHAMRCFLKNYTHSQGNQVTTAVDISGQDIVCDEEALEQVRV
jgi:hypothetical protein